jgi:hypothetical protein
MPRTTLDIDTAVLRELKVRQRREGKTLGQLVSELLASALGRDREPDHEPEPFIWLAKPMEALVDLENQELVRRAQEGSLSAGIEARDPFA